MVYVVDKRPGGKRPSKKHHLERTCFHLDDTPPEEVREVTLEEAEVSGRPLCCTCARDRHRALGGS